MVWESKNKVNWCFSILSLPFSWLLHHPQQRTDLPLSILWMQSRTELALFSTYTAKQNRACPVLYTFNAKVPRTGLYTIWYSKLVPNQWGVSFILDHPRWGIIIKTIDLQETNAREQRLRPLHYKKLHRTNSVQFHSFTSILKCV